MTLSLMRFNSVQPIIKAALLANTFLFSVSPVAAQDRIHYTGTEMSNPNHHDGQLSPVVGVHNIQIMRASDG